jgi:hypothetical protein
MTIPITYVLSRVTAAVVSVLIITAFGLGLSGRGPLTAVHSWTHGFEDWLYLYTGVRLR